MRIVHVIVLSMLLAVALLTACSGLGGSSPAAVYVSFSDPAASFAPKLAGKIGKPGKGNGTLNRPIGIALDAKDQVYVSDLAGVHVFRTNGSFVRTVVPAGEGLGVAGGLALGPNGDLFVADVAGHVVRRFDASGRALESIGQQGTGEGQFNGPTDVAVDAQGNLYVVDQGNSRIQKFDAQGKFVKLIGSRGEGNGQFVSPRSLGVDATGNLYVTDLSSFYLQKLDGQGNFVARMGNSTGDEHFWLMRGVAVDGQGTIYASDGLNSRVQVFDPEGKLVLQFGQPGEADGQFRDAEDVGVDGQGMVYVVDKANNRVQKFKLK